MTIEQKAKAYDEALERAKKWRYAPNVDKMPTYGSRVIDEIFPKLKENEDGRIRKDLCTWLEHKRERCTYPTPKEKTLSAWIAWLEKQGERTTSQVNEHAWLYLVSDVLTWKDGIGQYLDDPRVQALAKELCSEYAQKLYSSPILSNSLNIGKNEQKPTDKVEPKFKVGYWYQCIKDFFGKGVTFDKNTAYYCAKEGCLKNEYGCHIAIVKDLYDNFKLWTIQDAKDGDVLVCSDYSYTSYLMFKCLEDKITLHCWYNDHTHTTY